MSYNKMRFAVGLFVLILFGTIGTLMFLLLQEKGTFDKRYQFHFETDSATAFNIGMPLKFSGFNIGVIDDIELEDDGTVYMTFSVTKKNRKWISEDSVLMIRKPLIGSPHIEVYSAIGNPMLKEGGDLMILMSDDINDMISKLQPAVEQITNIISSIDKIATTFAKDDSDLMKTLRNIEKFTNNLAKNKSLLTSITGDDKATQDVVKSIDILSKIMGDIKAITSRLDKDMVDPASSSLKELEAIMKDVKGKLKSLDGVVNSVGAYDKDILELKDQIGATVQKSNEIMDKVDALMQDEDKDEVVLP